MFYTQKGDSDGNRDCKVLWRTDAGVRMSLIVRCSDQKPQLGLPCDEQSCVAHAAEAALLRSSASGKAEPSCRGGVSCLRPGTQHVTLPDKILISSRARTGFRPPVLAPSRTTSDARSDAHTTDAAATFAYTIQLYDHAFGRG